MKTLAIPCQTVAVMVSCISILRDLCGDSLQRVFDQPNSRPHEVSGRLSPSAMPHETHVLLHLGFYEVFLGRR